jgi:hypothetical protein
MAKKKYFIDAALFQKIKSLDFSEMNDWLARYYQAAYQDGIDAVPGADITDVLKAIGEVKGIGPKRLAAIKEALDRL